MESLTETPGHHHASPHQTPSINTHIHTDIQTDRHRRLSQRM